MTRTQEELAEARQSLNHQSERLTSLQRSVDSLAAERDTLTPRSGAREAQQQLRDEAASARREMEEMATEHTHAVSLLTPRASKLELRSELDTVSAALQASKDAFDKSHEELADLTETMERSRTEHKEHVEAAHVIAREAKQAHEDQAAQLAQREQDVDQLRAMEQHLRSQLQQLEMSVGQSNSAAAAHATELAEQLAGAQQELEAAHDEASGQAEVVWQLENAAEQSRETVEENLESLQQQVAQTTGELDAAHAAVAAAEQQFQAEEVRAAQLEEAATQASTDAAQAASEIAQLTKDLEAARAELVEAQLQHAAPSTDDGGDVHLRDVLLNALQSHSDVVNTTSVRLEEVVAATAGRVRDVEQLMATASTKAAAAVSTLQADVKLQRQRCEAAEVEMQSAQSLLTESEERVADVTARLHRVEEQLRAEQEHSKQVLQELQEQTRGDVAADDDPSHTVGGDTDTLDGDSEGRVAQLEAALAKEEVRCQRLRTAIRECEVALAFQRTRNGVVLSGLQDSPLAPLTGIYFPVAHENDNETGAAVDSAGDDTAPSNSVQRLFPGATLVFQRQHLSWNQVMYLYFQQDRWYVSPNPGTRSGYLMGKLPPAAAAKDDLLATGDGEEVAGDANGGGDGGGGRKNNATPSAVPDPTRRDIEWYQFAGQWSRAGQGFAFRPSPYVTGACLVMRHSAHDITPPGVPCTLRLLNKQCVFVCDTAPWWHVVAIAMSDMFQVHTGGPGIA